MTEREKMIAGQPYQSRDPELLAMYHGTKEQLAQFAATPSTEVERKREIMRRILGRVGEGVWIEAPFFCDYGQLIHIGNNCFINYNCVFLDSSRITLGDNVLIGPAVQLYTAPHPLPAPERIVGNGYVTQSRPIAIGDNCWIGGGVLVMPGVTIGESTTIGAGSVVIRDVPSGCFAAGNPCRVLRTL